LILPNFWPKIKLMNTRTRLGVSAVLFAMASLLFMQHKIYASSIFNQSADLVAPVLQATNGSTAVKNLVVYGRIAINDTEAGKRYLGDPREDDEIERDSYHRPGNPTHVCIFLANRPSNCYKVKVDTTDGTFKITIPLTSSDVEYLRKSKGGKVIYAYAVNPLTIGQGARTAFYGYSRDMLENKGILIFDSKTLVTGIPMITLKGTLKFGKYALDNWGPPYHSDTSVDNDLKTFKKMTGKDCRSMAAPLLSGRTAGEFYFDGQHEYAEWL
jgi:hypothetical protein